MTRYILLALALALMVSTARAGSVRMAIAGYPDPVASFDERMPTRLESGHLFILLDDARWTQRDPADHEDEEPIPTAETQHSLAWELVVPMTAKSVTLRGLRVRVGDRWTIHDGASPFVVEIKEFVRFVGDEERGDDLGYDEVFAVAKLPAGRGPDPSYERPEFYLAAPHSTTPPVPLRPGTPAPHIDRKEWMDRMLRDIALGETIPQPPELLVRPLSMGSSSGHLAVLNIPVENCQSDYGCTQPSQLRIFDADGAILHEELPSHDPTIIVVADVDGDGCHDVLTSSCRHGCGFTVLTWRDGRPNATHWEMESGC